MAGDEGLREAKQALRLMGVIVKDGAEAGQIK